MSLPRSLQELMRKCAFQGETQKAAGSASDETAHSQSSPATGFAFGDSASCVGLEAEGSSSSKRVVKLPEPTPSTPQGLKPRRSVASLKSYLQVDRDYSSIGQPVAPPSSTLSSPIVSTSGFYSSSSGATPGTGTVSSGGRSRVDVAESPVLLPGRARTAVGALVAAASAPAKTCEDEDPPRRHGFPRSEESASSLSPFRTAASSARALNRSLHSILPPFDEEEYHRASCGAEIDEFSPIPPPVVDPNAQRVAERLRCPGTSPRPRRLLDAAELPPMQRGPRQGPLSHFERFRSTTRPLSPMRDSRYDYRDDMSEGSLPHSPAQSIVASPSSLAKGLFPVPKPFQDVMPIRGQDVPGGTSSPSGFDFREEPADFPFDRDVMLKRQKSSNQRRAHEDLVLAVQERLQDELELVREIQRQLGSETSASGSQSASQSLLAGFPAESARRATGTISHLLQELDVAEQYFFASPSDMDAVAVPRNIFREALMFCLRMVRVSSTVSGDQPLPESHWRLSSGIRASLGLIPETPRMVRRGGDTSVFSLPCDDSSATPMTSNVSASTTITTRTYGTNLLSPSQHHEAPRFHHQALEVRHTIASVATILDRFSALLLEETLPAQEIKRAYLEMQTLDVTSLRSVLESFEMEQPESIVELMSGSASQDDEIPVVPPPYATSIIGRVGPPHAVRENAPGEFFSPVLRSKSENRPEDGKDPTEAKVNQVAQGPIEGKVQRHREAGRRGWRRASRSSLKLQDA